MVNGEIEMRLEIKDHDSDQYNTIINIKGATEMSLLLYSVEIIKRTPTMILIVSILVSSFGAGGGGRTRTVLLPLDFESSTSANSITPACFLQL